MRDPDTRTAAITASLKHRAEAGVLFAEFEYVNATERNMPSCRLGVQIGNHLLTYGEHQSILDAVWRLQVPGTHLTQSADGTWRLEYAQLAAA